MSISATTQYMLESFHECAIQDIFIKMVVGADHPAPEELSKFLVKQVMNFEKHESVFKKVVSHIKELNAFALDIDEKCWGKVTPEEADYHFNDQDPNCPGSGSEFYEDWGNKSTSMIMCNQIYNGLVKLAQRAAE
tara:strand:+ start:2547 stop:2951 length:405 start_codon:yes stop_codon:yes gene_type:complete